MQVAKHKRDHLSLRPSGQNVGVQWRDPAEVQDGHVHGALVVQTSQSHLIYHSLFYTAQPSPVPFKAAHGPSTEFPQGSGEGTPIPGLNLRCDSYLDLHKEGISAWCATDDFCLVASRDPLQLLVVPWHVFTSNLDQIQTSATAPKRAGFSGVHVTSCCDLDWLIDKQCRSFLHNSAATRD